MANYNFKSIAVNDTVCISIQISIDIIHCDSIITCDLTNMFALWSITLCISPWWNNGTRFKQIKAYCGSSMKTATEKKAMDIEKTMNDNLSRTRAIFCHSLLLKSLIEAFLSCSAFSIRYVRIYSGRVISRPAPCWAWNKEVLGRWSSRELLRWCSLFLFLHLDCFPHLTHSSGARHPLISIRRQDGGGTSGRWWYMFNRQAVMISDTVNWHMMVTT